MMLRRLAVIVVLVTLGALAWVATRPRDMTRQTSAPREPAANHALLKDLALTANDGRAVRLSDFRGAPLVVNSWAAWCPFCVKELPDFAAVQEEFGNRVQIVAVNRVESLETATKFTDTLGVTEKLFWLLDPEDTFYKSIGGFTMPETLFVGADGTIVFHKRGVMAREEIRQRVSELVSRGRP